VKAAIETQFCAEFLQDPPQLGSFRFKPLVGERRITSTHLDHPVIRQSERCAFGDQPAESTSLYTTKKPDQYDFEICHS